MKKRVSLVLSGGGARGMAHIGVIEELESRGFEIAEVTGTSMGAVVGAVYAMGKLKEFKEWLYTLDKLKVFRLMDFTLSKQGLLKGDKVLNRMKEFVEDRKIEELEIPYAAVAVDLLNKKEVVFREGSVYEAIRASIAIPGVLTPVKTKDGLLVDGGVMDNIPVKHAAKKRNTLLVAVDVNGGEATVRKRETKQEKEDAQYFLQRQLNGLYNYLGIRHESKHESDNDSKKVSNSKGISEEKCESGSGVKGKGSSEGSSEGTNEGISGGKGEGKSKGTSEGKGERINEGSSEGKIEENLGYIDLINRTITLMTHHMAQLSLEIHKPDIYIEVSGDSCGIFDFYKAEEIVERGRKAAAKILKGK